ncbi:MAG: inosine/xanthosine triphosphatase [Candidatus Microsaccharimonas sp.]
MKIIVGTKNQKKVDVVTSIFKEIFKLSNLEVIAHNANSLVPEAPHDNETYEGAANRAVECSSVEDADYYVGIESGLVKRYGNFFEEAWAVVISKDGVKQIGYSSGLLLPSVVVDRMNKGEMHNDIMADFDKLFNLPDDNRDTWSRYTGGYISRQVSLEESLRNALLQSVATEKNLYTYK